MSKMPQSKDGRDLWLDETVVNASGFLAAMQLTERKRNLSEKETDMRNLALAFMYLYNVVEEQELLNEVESFFGNETIH
ncbi:MAG TPA: hypothetical protein DCW83_10190 [Saprospirales bacterium]|jgi:hypothetical protein|nr:hypothetical protein [Saprospirales bacterium]